MSGQPSKFAALKSRMSTLELEDHPTAPVEIEVEAR